MPNAELEMQNAHIAAASVFSFGIKTLFLLPLSRFVFPFSLCTPTTVNGLERHHPFLVATATGSFSGNMGILSPQQDLD